MCVTLSTADDFEELTELWEASVRATHHFIPEQYILKLKPLVWSVYLRSMPVYTGARTGTDRRLHGDKRGYAGDAFCAPSSYGKGSGEEITEVCH